VNRPIRRVAVFAILLIAALLVNATWVQAFHASALDQATGNQRQLLAEYSRQRGPILVDGEAVARSVPTTDRLKYLRRYPGGAEYAPITGYDSYIYGTSGIEASYDTELSGDDDALAVRRIVDVVTGTEAQGASVELTIDPAAQDAAWKGLDGKQGAVVAIEPSTGRILALASSPSYDPAVLSSHDGTAIEAAWKKLDPASPSSPVLDRAANQTYPPGSTFKLVTAAAALDSGKYTPDTELPGPARLLLTGTSTYLPNEDGESCGPDDQVTLRQALAISCNTAFAGLGGTLGQAALRKQAAAFGFGTDLLPDLDAAPSRFPSGLDPSQTEQSAIGQFSVTASVLQMAVVAATIADKGVRHQPYVVSRVLSPNLQQLSSTTPDTGIAAMTPAAAAALTSMMETVVATGTGTPAQINGIQVAGKTGTAQQGTGTKPVAWFVAFAPAQDPKVAVAVAIPDADIPSQDIAGGKLAAPIAKAVIEAVLNP
jgi:peptidoglycan glycosyltransferase